MKLEDLEVDTHVAGIEPSVNVKVLYLKKAGADAFDVTYELLSGQVLKKTLFRADEDKLSLASAGRVWAFDAKPASFKLAAEATRIKLAYLFDPMMAVHTSDVEPLPHQISAVYETMLPKQPLRFVLADDPGAGKTIMAGLLIRELMLRGDLERCLIIAPGSLVEQWQTELSQKFGLRFDLLTNALVESTATGNAFVEHNRLIARLDQLTRKVEWHDKLFAEGAVLVELKQWSLVDLTDDGRLAVAMRSGLVQLAHPSFQVDGYRRHLTNFVRAFHNQPVVRVDCCVYAHNYPGREGSLFDPQYSDVMVKAPVFCATDAEALAGYMRARLGDDRGAEVVDRVRREGFAPSRLLIENASEMIRRQDVFTMLDEQIPAQQSIVRSMNDAIRCKGKSIVLVEGGPGTGKSVIALDALGHAIRKKQVVHLVSGSAAFTHGMRRLLGPELAPLVRFTDFFWEHAESSVDVLIVDEAHRIRAKSVPKVVAARRPKISQLEELVRAARVTVLFMDTNQIIQPDESGDPTEVAALAARLGIKLTRHRLRAQFRCDGSSEYLRWADALFGLTVVESLVPVKKYPVAASLIPVESSRKSPRAVAFEPRQMPGGHILEVREASMGYPSDIAQIMEAGALKSPATFDFDVLDSPHDLLAWVRAKNVAEPNSARLTAGWCWPWSNPLPDGSLVNDIVIGDFAFPWELKSGKRGKPGVPEAKHWAVDPGGADQAGTVYSVQGFEFRYVGVLMGPDLVIRACEWVANPRANCRNGLRAKSPNVASIYLRRIYRTLFTRPLRGLRVFSVDPETREFLRSQIDRTPVAGRASAARGT